MNDKSNIRIPNPPDPPQDREIYDSTTVTIGCGFPIMILFFLISFFLFVSCSTTRTVNSASQETKMSLNTEDHSHATGSTETKTDTHSTSDITTTRKGDTIIHDPGGNIGSSFQGSDLITGRHHRSESGNMILDIYLDSSGTVHGIAIEKPSDNHVNINQTTTEHKNVDQTGTQKQNTTADADKKSKATTDDNTMSKNKEIIHPGIPTWGILLMILATVIGIAVLLWRLKVF